MALVELLLVSLILAVNCDPVVKIKNGEVVGSLEESYKGRPYLAFRGIPYAKPPTGKRRFKISVPIDNWEGVFNATIPGSFCAQGAHGSVFGQEDCLHVSVYTPKISLKDQNDLGFPVLVWLPGGSFVSGGAADYDPWLLMDKDIVLVVPQYRLGLLGMFHRVISLSGSPLSPWAFYTRSRVLLSMVATYLECPLTDTKRMAECLQEVPLTRLLTVQNMCLEAKDCFVGNERISPSALLTIKLPQEEAFITDVPLNYLSSGNYAKVPVILGLTRDIGSYLLDFYINEPEIHEDKLAELYFPGETFTELSALIPGLTKLLGDIYYSAGIFHTAIILADQVTTNVFSFEFEGGPKLFNQRHPDPMKAPPMPSNAVSHGDEMFFILPEKKVEMNEESYSVAEFFLDAFENFAYGRSVYDNWKPFTRNGLETLVISGKGKIKLNERYSDEARTDALNYVFGLVHKVDKNGYFGKKVHKEL